MFLEGWEFDVAYSIDFAFVTQGLLTLGFPLTRTYAQRYGIKLYSPEEYYVRYLE